MSGSVAANGGVKYAVGDTLTLAVGDRMNGNRILGQHTPYMSGNASGDDKETFVPDSEKLIRLSASVKGQPSKSILPPAIP